MDAAVLESPAREARVNARTAAAILAFAVALTATMQGLGAGTRGFAPAPHIAPSPAIVVVGNGREALATWRQRGLRGRVLVHVGRFFHFVADDHGEVARQLLTGPGQGGALDDRLFRTAAPRNYLWIAASTGIARRIVYVSPPEALDARLASLRLERANLPARLPSQAMPRFLHAAFPAEAEPVLVEVSASWFDEPGALDPLAALRASGLRADLIVVNLAEDADDVSERARAAARALALRLSALAPGEAG